MAWPIIVAWIHYVSIMLMIASLLGEHLLEAGVDGRSGRTIQRLDIIYGASATIVLITGILRMFLEKGPAYYNHHIAFHILLGIFIFAALLSVYPTVIFLRWRSDTGAGQGNNWRRINSASSRCIVRDGNGPVAAGAVLRNLDGARRVLGRALRGRPICRDDPFAMMLFSHGPQISTKATRRRRPHQCRSRHYRPGLYRQLGFDDRRRETLVVVGLSLSGSQVRVAELVPILDTTWAVSLIFVGTLALAISLAKWRQRSARPPTDEFARLHITNRENWGHRMRVRTSG